MPGVAGTAGDRGAVRGHGRHHRRLVDRGRLTAAGECDAGETPAPACVVRASADTAWRLLFNALSPEQIGERVIVTGDASLAVPLLRARSVIV